MSMTVIPVNYVSFWISKSLQSPVSSSCESHEQDSNHRILYAMT